MTPAVTLEERAWRRAWPVVACAAAFWAAVLGVVVMARYGGDMRGLILPGQGFRHPSSFAGVPLEKQWGYDGQFYAALATDPFLLHAETIASLDAPGYRASRIGLSLLAWALAAGQPRPAIILYQLLCWALALAGVAVAARWLGDEGDSPWWALPLAFTGGVAFCMLRSLPDAGAASLVLLALWLAGRRHGGALPVIALACLVRETSLLAAAALASEAAFRRRFRWAAALALVPFAAVVAWRLWVRHRLGQDWPTPAVFGIPFGWMPAKLAASGGLAGLSAADWFSFAGMALSIAGAAALAMRPGSWRSAELAYVAFLGLGLLLNYAVYVDASAYTRALVAVSFLAPPLAARQPAARGRWTLRAVPLAYAAIGLMAAQAEWHLAVRSPR